MNLPYILRKYFGGNLHLKRKLVQIKLSTLCLLYLIKVWKEKKVKGKNWKRVKVVENQKRLWVSRWLKKKKKKKSTPLIEYSNNIVISMSILSRKSYGVDLVDISFIVLSTKYFPSLLWFPISISFLALTLWPVITTLIKDLLISDFGVWLH